MRKVSAIMGLSLVRRCTRGVIPSRCLSVLAVSVLAAQTNFAGTTNSFFTNTALTDSNNYSAGTLPNNTTDVLLTTTGLDLRITTGSVTAESISATNGLSYTIGNYTTTANNRTLTLGNNSGFTNAYSGMDNDLLFLTNGSSLDIIGANQSTGTGTLNLVLASSGNLSVASGSVLAISAGVSGSFSLIKTGDGMLTLSGANTYGGATTVGGGSLRIDGNARLGNTASGITLSNAGILEVTAAGALTNAITIGAGNGVLSNSSAGALVIAGAVSKDGTVFTSRSGSGTNVFTGVISGASANSDFIVDGGTTVFSNVMTYNGPTIITNGGTLVLGTNNATPATSGLVLGGGTLLIGDATTRYSTTFASLTLTEDSTIDMGANGGLGTLTFGDSSAISWNGTLTITNWQGVAATQSDVTKLLFGVGGLDSDQRAQIQFAGYEQGSLLIDGELAPIPEAPVVWGAAAVAAFIIWRERRRLLDLLRSLRPPTV
jgi:fibronectin-binding autotransporter adhesin